MTYPSALLRVQLNPSRRAQNGALIKPAKSLHRSTLAQLVETREFGRAKMNQYTIDKRQPKLLNDKAAPEHESQH